MSDENINEIKNPKEQELVIKTKSVLISRHKRESPDDDYKTAILRFFSVNNPHMQEVFPDKVIIYTNTEKIRIMGFNVSYYLEGNDIVINDLEELKIKHEDTKLFVTGKQVFVERRK
ncbi:hypothetical protein JW711_06345 [Candidatus Woesearchaeota archaeon]|nr:hypothetical protein [Candidatus Woesearchaeota archaeon]